MPIDEKAESQFASEEELAKIAEVRTRLAPELEALKAEGKNFDHFTSDIFFTRLVRGNNQDVAESVEWYKNYLALRQERDLDTVHQQITAKGLPWTFESIPDHEVVEPWLPDIFDERTQRTADGHLLWYTSMEKANYHEMLKADIVPPLLNYAINCIEQHVGVLDRLSAAEGRMVKNVRIIDFHGWTFWMWNSRLSSSIREAIGLLLTRMSIESSHRLYIINFNKSLLFLLNVALTIAPKRFTEKLRILGPDFMTNEDFARHVGQAAFGKLAPHTLLRGSGGSNALEGKAELIPAGSTVERSVEVAAGQRVSWEFTIGVYEDHKKEAGASLGLMSKVANRVSAALSGVDTEMVFSVKSLWTDVGELDAPKFPASVRSAGLEGGDAVSFSLDGADVAFEAGTGLNVLTIDTESSRVLSRECYDLAADGEGASAKLAQDIQALPRGTGVMLGIKGTGAENLTEEALEALRTLGSTLAAGIWHEGYALIGVKGAAGVAEARGKDVTAEGNVFRRPLAETLVENSSVTAKSGSVSGSVEVARQGVVCVTWSNYHCFFAAKMLASFRVWVE